MKAPAQLDGLSPEKDPAASGGIYSFDGATIG